jgi:hypothetical protein
MSHETRSLGFTKGGVAFLAGVLVTLVTAYAVVVRKRPTPNDLRPEYGGYDGDLGI